MNIITDQIKHLQTIFDANGSKELFLDHATGRRQNYTDVLNTSSAIAQKLSDAGVMPGSYVCVLADNSLEMLNLFFGIWQSGACAVPINPQLSKGHIADILNSFASFHLLMGANYGEFAREIEAELKPEQTRELIVFSALEQPSTRGMDLSQVIDDAPQGQLTQNLFNDLDGDAPCMIVFTSGSTKAPKGVSISMNRLVANERLFCSAMGLDADSRFVHVFPMSYLAGIHNLLLLPLSVGGSIVVTPALSGKTLYEFWEIVKDYHINTLWFTATMLSMLLKVDDGENLSFLKSQIRCSLVGMAPLPPTLKDQFEQRFHLSLHENYALSETAFISTSRPGMAMMEGSKGKILDSVDVIACDVENRDKRLNEGQQGELLVSSPYLMLGYYNASSSDNENLVEDGFYTGDIGYVENGYLFLTGRKKDLIIRGGINIAPALVEASIASVADVLEVAVVGIKDEDYGEEVAAAIALGEGVEELSINDLQEKLRDKLPYFQRPKKLKIVDQLPKGMTGKIDKNAVRDLF